MFLFHSAFDCTLYSIGCLTDRKDCFSFKDAIHAIFVLKTCLSKVAVSDKEG